MRINDDELPHACQTAIIEAKNWNKAAEILIPYNRFESQICVMLLYSIELYLKAILMNKGTNVTDKRFKSDYSHDIYKLYNLLKEEEKEIIRKGVQIDKCIYLGIIPIKVEFNDFDHELKYVSKGFIDYRYEYESFCNGQYILTLTDFIISINNNAKKLAFMLIGDKYDI